MTKTTARNSLSLRKQPYSPDRSGAGFSKDQGKGYEHEEFGSGGGYVDVAGIGRLLHADGGDVAERHSIPDQGRAQRENGRWLLRIHRYRRQAYSRQGR